MGDGPHIIVHEDDYWSNARIGDRRLTWKEAWLEAERRGARAQEFASILFDLDRCQHGRHEGDTCDGCGGASQGNPLLPAGGETAGNREFLCRQIGYGIDGTSPIVVPPRGVKDDPAAWRMPIPEGLR